MTGLVDGIRLYLMTNGKANHCKNANFLNISRKCHKMVVNFWGVADFLHILELTKKK